MQNFLYYLLRNVLPLFSRIYSELRMDCRSRTIAGEALCEGEGGPVEGSVLCIINNEVTRDLRKVRVPLEGLAE